MRRELKGGLILRSLSEGVESDRVGLPGFYEAVFGEDGDPDATLLNYWAYDLINSGHPTVTWDDIWVVVDPTKNDEIVSALLLIPQTWRYEDVTFGMGRVELVATHKDYRRRGLVRDLMDAAHERSESLGHLVQGVTGIRHYYRRFGYGMSANLGSYSSMVISSIPDIEDPEFTLRPAVEGDVPQLVAWSVVAGEQVSVQWDEVMFQFEINQRNPESVNALRVFIIMNKANVPVGYVGVRFWEARAALVGYVVGEESSYLETFSHVLYGMKRLIDTLDMKPEYRPTTLYFDHGLPEMVHVMVRKSSGGAVFTHTYAWYIRIPDVGAFLKHIAPVLERRLNGSAAHGYTGNLTIEFFDFTGVILTFEKGQLVDVVHRPLTNDDTPDAGFAFYSFFDLIFGRRTVLELGYILPEVNASLKGQVLLDVLFPKGHSWLMALT